MKKCFKCNKLRKEQFAEWAKNSQAFKELYQTWQESGFKRGLTPSVDRIDNSGGYTLDNIQWLSLSDNTRKFTS